MVELRLKYPPEKADFLILDPESEYGKVITELGGEVFHVGRDSINPFDLEVDLTERSPLPTRRNLSPRFVKR